MPGRDFSPWPRPHPTPKQQQVSRALFNSWMLGSKETPHSFAQMELHLSLCS